MPACVRLDSENSTNSQDTNSTILSWQSNHELPLDQTCPFSVGEEETKRFDGRSSETEDSPYESIDCPDHFYPNQAPRHNVSLPSLRPQTSSSCLPSRQGSRRVRTASNNFPVFHETEEKEVFLQGAPFDTDDRPNRDASVSSGYAVVLGNKLPQSRLGCGEGCDCSKELKNLKQSCRRQRYTTLSLVGVNVVLIVCVVVSFPVVLLTQFMQPTGAIAGTVPTLSPMPAPDQQYCISCNQLGPYKSLDLSVGVEERDGLCCFRSLGNIVGVTQEVARHVAKKATEDFLLVFNGPDGKIIGQNTQCMRSAIHLRNRPLNPDGFTATLLWEPNKGSIGTKGRLLLSDDGTSVMAPTDGYYYVYSKVRYSKQATGNELDFTFEIRLYRERNNYKVLIETLPQRCNFDGGSVDHTAHMERVLVLKEGDKLSINVTNVNFLSRDSDVHSFGAFEI